MATPATAFPGVGPFARSRTVASTRAPWSIYAVLFASTSVILGVIWDISWHRSIGRDTFWTPAHMAIYLGGMVENTAFDQIYHEHLCYYTLLKATTHKTSHQTPSCLDPLEQT